MANSTLSIGTVSLSGLHPFRMAHHSPRNGRSLRVISSIMNYIRVLQKPVLTSTTHMSASKLFQHLDLSSSKTLVLRLTTTTMNSSSKLEISTQKMTTRLSQCSSLSRSYGQVIHKLS